jgi:hypothetical protein
VGAGVLVGVWVGVDVGGNGVSVKVAVSVKVGHGSLALVATIACAHNVASTIALTRTSAPMAGRAIAINKGCF